MPRPRRVLLVANPISGSGRNRVAAQQLAAELERLVVASETAFTDCRGHAIEIAARAAAQGFDAVIAVGGDGTLREIADGVAAAMPIGCFPTGTANVMARELALPYRVDSAARAIAEGRTAAIDTAIAAGRRVLFVVGAGFDAEVLRELERVRCGPISYFSYVKPVVRAVARYRPAPLRVAVDAEPPVACAFAIVSNARFYAGPWVRLARDRSMQDGAFEVYRFATPSIPSLLRAGLRGILGALPGGSVTRARGRRIRIESDEATPVQIDGDVAGTTPVEIEVHPRSFHMIVPSHSPLAEAAQ